MTMSSTDLEENFVRKPMNTTVVENNDITLYCTAPNGYPSPSIISWLFKLINIKMIKQDGRIMVTRDGLYINNATIIDSGAYQCVASNGYYNRSSDFAHLSVELCE